MSETAIEHVALCGLGNMGGLVAGRLAAAFEPRLYDVDRERAEAVASGLGLVAASRLDELTGADVVVLCLPHPDISLDVVASLAPRLTPDAIIVETSTVGAGHVKKMAQLAGEHRISVVDAAIAAGVGQMAAGTAALLVGGDPAQIERVRPVLEAIAANVYVVGSLGSGAALKVINNAVAHSVMVVLVEAAALAATYGIEREHVLRLMLGNDAGLTRPLEHRLMERIADGNYVGGMPTEAALKDSMLALAMAHEQRVPLFAISGTHAVYEIATAQGFARDDYASIARLWEQWTDTTLEAPRYGS